jgi:hypothetical protein
VVSGGTNGSKLDGVFSTKDGANFELLPDLPAAVDQHCLVIINEHTLFLAGGSYLADKADKAYLFTGYVCIQPQILTIMYIICYALNQVVLLRQTPNS